MADDKSSWLSAFQSIPLSEAMPFGAGTTPEGSPTALSNMVKALIGRPQRAIEASARDLTHLGDHSLPKESVAPVTEQTLGMMGRGMATPIRGTAGVFGGKLAQGADLRALEEAQLMASKGQLSGPIRNDTGWFRSPADMQWRFEIPDNKAALKYMPDQEGARAMGSVESLMSHPELFKNYPQIRGYKMDVTRQAGEPSGLWDANNQTAHVVAPTMQEGRSVGLHELQHAVQNIEGFSPGNNPSYYAYQIEQGMRKQPEAFKGYDFNQLKDQAHQLYHKTAGEVESRNVQNRMNYSPSERQVLHPWSTQDVPYIDQYHFNPVQQTLTALRDKT